MTILTSLACTLSAAGISRPAYSDILETLQYQFKSIYGDDAYIEPDSQDGQLLAVFAKAVDDVNAQTVNVYNSFSPATAQEGALSNVVKINGINRQVATKSSVLLRITGTVGSILVGAVASDGASRWLIPDGTVIPGAGFIDVTAEAESVGAVGALTGTITTIETPTLGWQAVTNLSAAAPGAAVEKDAALRKRQALSTGRPTRTVLEGIVGAVADLDGVTQLRAYENDANAVDANGLPPHSIALVVQGGVAAEIAQAILLRKGPGCYTQGTTSLVVYDSSGNPNTIRFYIPTSKRVIASVTIKGLTGYNSTIGDALKAKVAAYVSALGIGKKVDIGKLYLPAQLFGGAGSETFELDILQIAFFGNALGTADLAIAFNELASLAVSDIALAVT